MSDDRLVTRHFCDVLLKVREVHPYFNQFEDQWPLAIYVCKYITSYLARNAMTESVKTSARLNDSYLHATISAKIQISFEAIPRPTVDDEIHLVDVNTRSDELQVAMGLMCRKIYDEFIVSCYSCRHVLVSILQSRVACKIFLRSIYSPTNFSASRMNGSGGLL